GVLAEQHLVALLQLELADLAVVEDLALSNRDDLAPDRLLGGGVRNHDPARRSALFLCPFDYDAIMQRTQLHGCLPVSPCKDVKEKGIWPTRRLVSTRPCRVPIIGRAARISTPRTRPWRARAVKAILTSVRRIPSATRGEDPAAHCRDVGLDEQGAGGESCGYGPCGRGLGRGRRDAARPHDLRQRGRRAKDRVRARGAQARGLRERGQRRRLDVPLAGPRRDGGGEPARDQDDRRAVPGPRARDPRALRLRTPGGRRGPSG